MTDIGKQMRRWIPSTARSNMRMPKTTTDIVERARLAAAPGGWGHANQELLGQLADEIERLRADLNEAAATHDLMQHKIEWLRALLKEARQYVSDAGNDEDPETQRHRSSLLSEIDR
jgi:hypothetical protein